MAKKAPGKAHREGLTVVELMDMFPTEEAATEWFESIICRTVAIAPNADRPYPRSLSREDAPTGAATAGPISASRPATAMQRSKIPLRKWAIAIYLCLTNLKSVSSMKLQRDIGVSQPTAWFMLHRIRQAWAVEHDDQFDGPVEVDETYFGGKRKNMSKAKHKELAGTGRGAVGKTAVVGMKDRNSNMVTARVVDETDAQTCKVSSVIMQPKAATVYTTITVDIRECLSSTKL